MLCNEFVDELNRWLDERCGHGDERLEEHARNCRVCRLAWEAFQRCERALAPTNWMADMRLTDCVLEQAKSRGESQRRRKRTVVMGFTVTIAAGFLALVTAIFHNPTHKPDAKQERVGPSTYVADVAPVPAETRTDPPASQWYASRNLRRVRDFWNLQWPADRTDASVTESVAIGLRPVAETMGSAFKVIRQNVLPTFQPPGSNDEQAGREASFTSLV